MASYALLNAFAGFEFDMAQGMIGFNPLQPKNGCFKCFWSLDSGWGEFEMSLGQAQLRLLYGQLSLKSLKLPFVTEQSIQTVVLDKRQLTFKRAEGMIQLQEQTLVKNGQILQVIWNPSS
jgi:hypothetical protein